MDLITLATKTTYKLFKVDEVIDSFDQKHFNIVKIIVKKYRNMDIEATKSQVQQLAENGIRNFWSELFKYIIVLSIASYFNIFTPTFFVMNAFSVLRALAGGVHMSTIGKCFAMMVLFFLSLGYLISILHINTLVLVVGISLGSIWSIYIAKKYSPQERPDKSDKDCDRGNIKKYKTIKFIKFSYIISMILILFTQKYIIGISIFTGVLLEMVTITPRGTRFFQWIDSKKVTL